MEVPITTTTTTPDGVPHRLPLVLLSIGADAVACVLERVSEPRSLLAFASTCRFARKVCLALRSHWRRAVESVFPSLSAALESPQACPVALYLAEVRRSTKGIVLCTPREAEMLFDKLAFADAFAIPPPLTLAFALALRRHAFNARSIALWEMEGNLRRASLDDVVLPIKLETVAVAWGDQRPEVTAMRAGTWRSHFPDGKGLMIVGTAKSAQARKLVRYVCMYEKGARARAAAMQRAVAMLPERLRLDFDSAEVVGEINRDAAASQSADARRHVIDALLWWGFRPHGYADLPESGDCSVM
jgi:hypothetical protein